MNKDMVGLLMENSNVYGEYYCKKVKDFFNEGDLFTLFI